MINPYTVLTRIHGLVQDPEVRALDIQRSKLQLYNRLKRFLKISMDLR